MTATPAGDPKDQLNIRAADADVPVMAEQSAERRLHEADREALVEATNETLQVYAELATSYADTIARQNELLDTVDETLNRVRRLLAET